MLCSKCGKKSEENAVVCTECGESLETAVYYPVPGIFWIGCMKIFAGLLFLEALLRERFVPLKSAKKTSG